ncbi:hypothetical protein N9878_01770 [bacterium]|nr:hypothetical protein [bacterium]
MTNDNDMLALIAKTQADMASTMADMGRSLANMEISHARMDERMITLLENNSRIDGVISDHGSRIRGLENLTNLNKFAVKVGPMMFFALISAFVAGGGIIFSFFKIISE